MKPVTRAALLAAGALLLTACASDSGGSTPASTPAAASSVTASSGGSASGVTVAPHTAAPTSPAASSASTAAVLDAQSVAWFDALCSEIAPITAVQNNGDDSSGDESPGQDAAARWHAKLNELRTLSQAFSATSTRLTATAPPTFDGGTDFAGKLTSGLSSAASTLTAAADELDAVDPTDATALAAAQPVFKTNVLEAVSALTTVSQLDPSVVAAVRGIPSCRSLGA